MNFVKPILNTNLWNQAKSSYLLLLMLFAVLGLSFQNIDTFHVFLDVLSESYIAVSVFVAFTLAIFYTLEAFFKVDTRILLKKYRHFQVPIAASLGALPGCGGAIIVVTQFVRGRLSFGGVVAVLTSTMGDAAFLLLAQEPKTGLFVMVVSIFAGMITGYIVDMIHKDNSFLPKNITPQRRSCDVDEGDIQPLDINWADKLWLVLIIPGFIFGILSAFQVESLGPVSEHYYKYIVLYLGAVGACLASIMWAYASIFRKHTKGEPYGTAHNIHMSGEKDHPVHRVIQDTNFVTTWVILAFFIYEMAVHLTGLDLGALLSGAAVLVPFIAILIGFVPGCGPQVLVTAMYLNGAVPLSAQLGNAISNDGDALFPAIALAPKAAIVATLYSALPAFVVAYGYMWLFES